MELEFIAALRVYARNPVARGLNDDAAVLDGLVITHDMLVEGVHFLGDDPPKDVAWKLLAVNLSDLAAKGAAPLAVLMGAGLARGADWDFAFAAGIGEAAAHFGVALIGGDTVKMPAGAPMAFGLTAIGRAGAKTPSRSGAQPGDALYVAGTIGDAGLGLKVAQSGEGPACLLKAYRRPKPLIESGQHLAPIASAMMDVSDGLLIDAERLASASGVALAIDLDALPRSREAIRFAGDDRAARLAAATAGDDYALLFTCAGDVPNAPDRITRIGQVRAGEGLMLRDADGPVPLPESLGWLHGR